MPATTCTLPRYTEGPDAYRAVHAICRPYGTRVARIVGAHGFAAMRARFEAMCTATDLQFSDPIEAPGDLTRTRLEHLMTRPELTTADMIFGIGGGKVLDTAKAVGERLGIPVFTFPTIASNCAATTAVSIVYTDAGKFDSPDFLRQGPAHCFIDTVVLADAPERYLWAGMGDTYAKYYEAELSARGDTLDYAKSLGQLTAQACATCVLSDGEAAYEANRQHRVTDAFTRVALTIIVTTGMVSLLVTLDHTPDYNSDLAHALYYTFTSMPRYDHTQLHGAVVAYGVLIMLTLDQTHHAPSRTALERVRAFNAAVGLPTSLSQIGLAEADVIPYLDTVCQMSDVQHRPYPVTPTDLLRAIREQERWRRTP